MYNAQISLDAIQIPAQKLGQESPYLNSWPGEPVLLEPDYSGKAVQYIPWSALGRLSAAQAAGLSEAPAVILHSEQDRAHFQALGYVPPTQQLIRRYA